MIKSGFFTLLTALVLLTAIYYPNLRRLYFVVTLFDEDKIVGNFRSMDQSFPFHLAEHGPVAPLKSDPRTLPEFFTFKGTVLRLLFSLL